MARDDHPRLGDKQFQKVEMTSRHNDRKKNTKRKEVRKVKFIAAFNPASPSIEGLIRNKFTIYIQMKFSKSPFQVKSFLLLKIVTKT